MAESEKGKGSMLLLAGAGAVIVVLIVLLVSMQRRMDRLAGTVEQLGSESQALKAQVAESGSGPAVTAAAFAGASAVMQRQHAVQATGAAPGAPAAPAAAVLGATAPQAAGGAPSAATPESPAARSWMANHPAPVLPQQKAALAP